MSAVQIQAKGGDKKWTALTKKESYSHPAISAGFTKTKHVTTRSLKDMALKP